MCRWRRFPSAIASVTAFVPKGRYLDPEFLRLELERVFPRTWLMACRVEELPGVGNYIEYRIHDRSVLIVRESTDSIRAYHNACRHRGTRLASGRGRVGSIICPFHGWRWNLDGSIRLVLDAEEFTPRSDDDLGLQAVRSSCGAASCSSTWTWMRRHCSSTSIRSRRFSRRSSSSTCGIKWLKGTIVPCNWKTVLDGFLEAYHVPGTHPQISRYDKTNTTSVTLRELERAHLVTDHRLRASREVPSAGQKRTQSTESRREKDPQPAEGAARRSPARASPATWSTSAEELACARDRAQLRAAELLKTAEIPEGMQPGAVVHASCIADSRSKRATTGRRSHRTQWAAAGTAWNVFPNTILLPNQGSVIGYRARPNGLDPDSAIFEMFCLEQIPVADYDKKWDIQPEFFEDFRQTPTSARSSRRTWRTPRTSRSGCTRRASRPPPEQGTGDDDLQPPPGGRPVPLGRLSGAGEAQSCDRSATCSAT